MRLRIAVESLLQGTLALSLWLACGEPAARARGAATLPLLKTVHAMRKLTPQQANARYPVELRAVVTFYNPAEYWALFAQDDTGGIFIKLPATNNVKPGDRILVQGETDAGDYAPMVLATNVVVESSGELPPPHPATFDELASGYDDGAWVEVTGVVRLAEPGTRSDIYTEIIVDGKRLSALVTSMDKSYASSLINYTVRVRGVCYSRPNSRRQIRAPWLAVTSANDIQVVEAARSGPVTVAFTNLLRYDPKGRFGERVRVRGVVALHQSQRAVYLVDGNQGLRAETQQLSPVLAPGDVVEVTGFPILGQYTPLLEDATFQVVGRQAPPAPLGVQAEQLLNDGFDASLVRLRAKLLNKVHGWRDLTLVAQSGNVIFNAHLYPDAADFDRIEALENGSEIELTGVCALQPIENWNPSILSTRPQSFQLLLRSANDVKLIAAPPWWTLSRLLWAVGIMSVTLLAGLMWLVVLDRRVRRQTEIIQQKAQREAVLEERSRIAREFHDTLEQELAAISIQLDTVSAQFENSPAIARDLLELTRNMSRRSLAEARRSVWDLRSHLLENSNLVTALAEVAKGLAANSPCQIVVSNSGLQRKLSASLENNLLRLAQEALNNALKHARAHRISVELTYAPQQIRLEIIDDGIGFNPADCPSIQDGHFGLLDMKERVERMGGSLLIESEPGRGAKIIVEVADRPAPETQPGLDQDELGLKEAV